MCGRYGFSIKDANEISERFGTINTLDNFTPRYNIAPGQMNPVILEKDGKKITRMFWGLIPYWAKDQKMKYHTINARAEGVVDAASYRKPFRFQRCLVPATFFYEPDKSQKPSIPYLFQLRHELMFSIAGLYDIWKNPDDGSELYSYTIITTRANEIVGKIHDRMPVILRKEDEETWMNPDLIEPEHLMPLLSPYPSDKMETYEVPKTVWNPKIDNADLIRKISPAIQQTL